MFYMVWGAVPAFSGCLDYMANAEWKISLFSPTGQQFSWRFRRWYAKLCQVASYIDHHFVRVMLVIKMVSKQAVQVSIYDLCITSCFFISDSSNCVTSIDSRSRPTQNKRKNWSLPFHWDIAKAEEKTKTSPTTEKDFLPKCLWSQALTEQHQLLLAGDVLVAGHQHYPRDGLIHVWVTERRVLDGEFGKDVLG